MTEPVEGAAHARKGTCGCWNAINPPHNRDLRGDAMHGTPGHASHARTTHAWCEICSPGSVPVFERLLGPRKDKPADPT